MSNWRFTWNSWAGHIPQLGPNALTNWLLKRVQPYTPENEHFEHNFMKVGKMIFPLQLGDPVGSMSIFQGVHVVLLRRRFLIEHTHRVEATCHFLFLSTLGFEHIEA